VDDELSWARAAWAGYAELDGGFWPGRVRLEVSPSARSCPPGGAGFVVLGDAAIVTVPGERARAALRDVLPGVPLTRLTDPAAVAPGCAAADVLGPADLAFAGPSRLRPAGTGTVALPVTDERVHGLLARVSPGDAAECGLAGVTSAVHAVIRDGQVAAAAGYTTWPGRVAHLSVLTDPGYRGQGLAATAGSAAAVDALSAGLLAQWRARVPASIAVAARLGFLTCGSQLSIRPAGLAGLGRAGLRRAQ
jgi:hypothetical protein